MGGVHPTAIITDQCESIKIALREVMPKSIHRFCLWHILSKLPQKFRGVTDFNGAITEFKGIIYDSMSVQMFENKWAEFLVKHRLERNEWLKDMFNERERWVPIYLNHIFWAGMVSTQRSEGMHAYFDDYVHSRSSLKQFMENYEVAITNKIQKEFLANFEDKNKLMKCITSFPWERQFQKAYTRSIFKEVQNEISRMMYCDIIQLYDVEGEVRSEAGIERCRVREKSIVNDFFVKEFTYTVEYMPDEEYISCNCKKFEFKGILCCHSLKVLAQKNIQNVNERYILRRWRKYVYRRHSSIFFDGGYPHMTNEYKKFQEVERYFQECIDAAMGSAQKMELVKQRCIDLKNDLLNLRSTIDSDVNLSGRTTEEQSIPEVHVLNPQVIRTRGRPRIDRYQSSVEANMRRGSGRRGRGRRGGANSGRGQTILAQTNSDGLFNIDLNETLVGTQGTQEV